MRLDTRAPLRLNQGRGPWHTAARAALATGLPLLGGTLAGQPQLAAAAGSTALLVSLSDIGRSPHLRLVAMAVTLTAIASNCAFVAHFGSGSLADRALVVACAFAAAALGGSAPGLAIAARFAAMAALSAVGLHADQPGTLPAVLSGGAWALLLTWAAWRLWPDEADTEMLDWRTHLWPALRSARSGWRFALCAALTALAAVLLGERLHLNHAYWATLTVVMVMQREGLVSLRLLLHTIAGTLLGVVGADLLWHLCGTPLTVALATTLAAALTRLGFAHSPALGVAGFTAFVVLVIDLGQRPFADPASLLWARLVDVGLGALLALLGTLLADAWRRAARVA
jgi:hypothetical protein